MHFSLASYIEALQSEGVYYFEKHKLQTELGLAEHTMNMSLSRLIRKKRIISPKRNFYVIVPIEYKTVGCPPVSWFIDPLMKFLGRDYYVAILSAASHHGAAHQRPYEFQVMTSELLRTINIAHHRIRFFTKKNIHHVATEPVNTHTGTMKVSTPEETAFDLIRYVAGAGYLNNVTTILIELSEKINARKLLTAAQHETKNAYIQRLGYLLDTYCDQKLTAPLYEWFQKKDVTFTALRRDKPVKNISLNTKWNIYINEEIEPDL